MPSLPHHSSRVRATVGLLILSGIWGCGGAGAPPPPQAGTQMGFVPDLRGTRVMLLPVQSAPGLSRGAPEAEVVFALTQRSDEVLWVEPADLRRMVQRTPGLDLTVDRLPVGMFLQAEVRRIGDPLYGYLRRLAAIADSDVALVPVQVRYRPETAERAGGVEIAAALIHARTGRVIWFGIVEGQEAAVDDPGAVASAAEQLARRIVPITGS